ncbi:MAG: M20/M25/M40 family metallo-hydrolase [Candidatus Rokubacteria bacterium]|nr:M20/M25/M40 family metallo-hydrolase [Candidatus Rokubacteria bacterium]
MNDVFEYIDTHRGRFVEELCALIRQPSVSAQNVGVTECAELVRRLMSEAGAEARLIPTPGFPVVYGEARASGAKRTVLIYGHYDVQPPEPLEAWETPPFEPSIRNGRIYARGAGDNKGQMFAHLKAVEAVLRTRGRLPVNVKLCFEGEEEIASRNFPAFLSAHRKLLAAALVYSSDGPMHPSGPMVYFGCRGILYLELTAHGAKRDLHSGNYGGVAPAPAARLCQAVASLWSGRGKVLVSGFYDRVRKPSPADRRTLRTIPFAAQSVREDLGCLPVTGERGRAYYRQLLLQPNLNVAGLTSGYQGPGMKTIIPNVARAKLDARLVMDQDPDEIEEKIRAHLKRRGFGDVEVKRLGAVPPSRTPVDHPLGKAVVRAVEQAWGRRPVIVPNLGGTIPDYLFTQVLGLPSIWVPYAPHDEANHAPNESITLEGFVNGIRSTAVALFEIAASSEGG